MEPIGWTEIILGVLTLLGGCAWFVNFRKDKQEAKGIRADNRQKEMDLSRADRGQVPVRTKKCWLAETLISFFCQIEIFAKNF